MTGSEEGARNIEDGLLRTFQRHSHFYVTNPPRDDNTLEWFALMQHHGAPTRLLDWSYSFFVALYLAIKDPTEAGQDQLTCAVWALNMEWLKTPFKLAITAAATNPNHKLKHLAWSADPYFEKEDTFREVFLGWEPTPLVAAVNPFYRNQRIVAQQGLFLCPSDISRTFTDNFLAVLKYDPIGAKRNFTQLIITVDHLKRRQILTRLNDMNINEAVLFPGLDGFAKSLEYRIALPRSHRYPRIRS